MDDERAGDVRVRVERSGGFAGRVLTGEVDTAELALTDPERARRLRELVGQVDVAALGAADPTAGPASRSGAGADRFCYSLQVDDARGSHHLEVAESALPDTLRPLIDHVLQRRP